MSGTAGGGGQRPVPPPLPAGPCPAASLRPRASAAAYVQHSPALPIIHLPAHTRAAHSAPHEVEAVVDPVEAGVELALAHAAHPPRIRQVEERLADVLLHQLPRVVGGLGWREGGGGEVGGWTDACVAVGVWRMVLPWDGLAWRRCHTHAHTRLTHSCRSCHTPSTSPGRTFFSMEHSAKHQSCCSDRFASSASIHSDLPLLGTPVTIVSSPGTTWGAGAGVRGAGRGGAGRGPPAESGPQAAAGPAQGPRPPPPAPHLVKLVERGPAGGAALPVLVLQAVVLHDVIVVLVEPAVPCRVP